MKYVFVVFLTFASSIWAADPLITSDDLATLLGYPRGKIIATDITEKYGSKYGDNLISAFSFTSSDNTFAPVTISVAREGTILTYQLKEENKRYFDKLAESSLLKAQVRKFQLSNGSEGYVGLGGIGPGGEGWRAVVTVSEKAVDIQMSVTVPGDPPLVVTSETAQYHESMLGSSDFWSETLIKGLQMGVDRVVSGQFSVVPSKQSSVPTPSLADRTNAPRTPESSAAQTSEASHSSRSLTLFSLLAGIAIAGLAAWYFLRK